MSATQFFPNLGSSGSVPATLTGPNLGTMNMQSSLRALELFGYTGFIRTHL